MALPLFGIFFLTAFIGLPIAVALLLAAGVPLFLFTDTPLMVIIQRLWVSLDSFSLMALPFFMIAGGILEKGGVSKRIVDFANSIVGGFHGGLAIVAFVASAFFGAISGSSTATVVAMGSIIVPAMIREGYDVKFSITTIAAAGYLGTVIPPSIPMVTYGVTTGASIGDLFSGGIMTGLLLTGLMSVYAYLYGKKHMKVTYKFSIKEVWRTFKNAIWALIMPLIILGGIYSGVFTPTESAAVACLYGLIVGFFVYKELSWKKVNQILKESVVNASMIMFIVGAASAFGFVMTKAQIPLQMSEFIISLTDSAIILLFLVNILFLILGTFMETNAAILIVAPIFMPIIEQYGIDPVHFGVLMVVNLSIGMVTPPLGVNLFVAAKLIDGVSVSDILNKYLFRYIGFSLIGLLIITYWEDFVLFLPKLFG
ncbi:TRAP transporter large permease [Caldibacillus lycopersici]|uniref:TRAP transporter large permease n=1 Tax=Perspicuibacillus lycopersici TaxID=1325689 RepID=A0AAE3IWH9_9BACI|nr:TRAP transporter large permease [Perspicuibacillus lycopersici]MCU9614883.1 TRAP transporter large permease [Perspicuibacillus lycopersici]